MSVQDIERAIAGRNLIDIQLAVEEFKAADRRDGTIKRLVSELDEAKARIHRLEEERADLMASVNLGLPHMNKRGTGYHGADKIKRLGLGRSECLSVLIEARAVDYAGGLSTDEVAARVKEMRDWQHIPYPENLSHSLGGRLSELQGLGSVRSETITVELKDEAEQKFRTGEERWFLTGAGQSIETPAEDMDPHEILQSYSRASP